MFSRIRRVSTMYVAVSLLFVLTAVLAVLNLDTTFAVRRVYVDQQSGQVDLYNQSFLIDFNRPIAPGQQLNELISIEPAQQLYFSVQGSELVVQASRALDSGANYVLRVNAEIRDVFDRPLEADYVHSFQTRDLDIYYVNPGYQDQLVRRGIGDQFEQVMFTAPDIVRHSVNGQYLAVITSESFEEQSLHLVNLKNEEVLSPLSKNYSVYEAQFVPAQPLMYFTARELDYNNEFGEVYTSRQLYLLDLNTFIVQQIELPKAIEDIEDIVIAPGGQALMFKETIDSTYYLMDVTDTLSPVSLGHFVATGGFKYDSQEIVFTAADFVTQSGFPYTVKLDAERVQTELTADGLSVIDPHWSSREAKLAVSRKYKDLDNSRGFYEMLILNSGGGEVLTVFWLDGISLELPQYSPDDRYISVEAYTQDQLQDLEGLRVTGYQAKPASGSIYVLDTILLNILETFEGVDAVWY